MKKRIYENPSAPGFLPYERKERIITPAMKDKNDKRIIKIYALADKVIEEWKQIEGEMIYDR